MVWNDKDALTPQNLNSRSGLVFNVKDPDFGALGDGTTDDTAAIQAAIDAANAAGGGIVFLPPATYSVAATTAATPVFTGRSNVTIEGGGRTTVITPTAAVAIEDVFHFASRTNFGVRDLKIDLSVETSAFEAGGFGIKILNNSNNFTLQNLQVVRTNSATFAGTDGIYLSAETGEVIEWGQISNIYLEGLGRQGLTLNQGCEHLTVSDIHGKDINANNGSLVHLEVGGSNPANKYNTISNCSAKNCSQASTLIGNLEHNTVSNFTAFDCQAIAFNIGGAAGRVNIGNRYIGCTVKTSVGTGFDVAGAGVSNAQLIGCYAENCGGSGIIAGAAHTLVTGATVIDCSTTLGGIRTDTGTDPVTIVGAVVRGITEAAGVHIESSATGCIVSGIETENCLQGVRASGPNTQVSNVFADGNSIADSAVVRITADDCIIHGLSGTGLDRILTVEAGLAGTMYSGLDLSVAGIIAFSADADFFAKNWFSNLGTSLDRVRIIATSTVLTVIEGYSDASYVIQGTSGNVTMTLPVAEIGMTFRFFKRDTDDLTIDANGSEEINNAANIANTSSEVTAMIAMTCVEAAEWIITEREGTWA
ncbi:hypothetical protein LCGC14_1777270 [marine sediment metagenome]|uniref:Rhamnogalacturonase A/B/Epimerase-like pectate lyase domain-containing protein n=1 Tax=marine sediment metagenome TaxID=412755 RepID=A0A0F9GWE2_9ZZZZ